MLELWHFGTNHPCPDEETSEVEKTDYAMVLFSEQSPQLQAPVFQVCLRSEFAGNGKKKNSHAGESHVRINGLTIQAGIDEKTFRCA
jgi:hypothetical protein